MKKPTVYPVVVAILSAAIVGASSIAAYKYLSTDTSKLGSQVDSTGGMSGDNINVMLTRPDDWHQIASRRLLEHRDLAGIDGSTATIPITAELARQFCVNVADDNMTRYVHHNKTDVAYENLIYGRENNLSWWSEETRTSHNYEEEVRLVFATPPSEDEYRMAEEAHVELDAEPIALDGFVFITHKDNPVDSLSVSQIRDIYTGKITNWKELGGRDEDIRAFQRTKNSGSQTAMEELVMAGQPMTDPPITFVAAEMGSLVEAVAEYENESAAIGYTYYYYINNLYKNPDIKVINIDGVSPDNENLLSGEYPFTAAYYAVIRADEPEDSVYRKVRDYMLTDEGQQIIELAGYCPAKE